MQLPQLMLILLLQMNGSSKVKLFRALSRPQVNTYFSYLPETCNLQTNLETTLTNLKDRASKTLVPSEHNKSHIELFNHNRRITGDHENEDI